MPERIVLGESEILVEVHAIADELDGHCQSGVAEVVVEDVEPRLAGLSQSSLRLAMLLGETTGGDEALIERGADLRRGLEVVEVESVAGGFHGFDVLGDEVFEPLQNAIDERGFRPEVIEQSTLGDTGLRGHCVQRRASSAELVEEGLEGVEQPLLGVGGIACHAHEPSRSGQRLGAAEVSAVADIIAKLRGAAEEFGGDLFVLVIESGLGHRYAHGDSCTEDFEARNGRGDTAAPLHDLPVFHGIAALAHLDEVGSQVGEGVDGGIRQLAKGGSITEEVRGLRPVEFGQSGPPLPSCTVQTVQLGE